MTIDYFLLIAVTIKITVLIYLSLALIRKWNAQDRKFLTDFPFLMAIGFILFAITKFFDIYLYQQYGSIDELLNYSSNEAINYARWRFSLGILSVFPVMLLMLIIWFEDKRRFQFILGISWLVISYISLFSSQNLKDFLLVSQIYSIPPILLSSITYFIIHKQKKIPSINSLLLGLGWLCFIIVQAFRPMFYNDNYDLKWIAELIETGIMILIGIGFFRHAFYSQKAEFIQKKEFEKKNIEEKKNQTYESELLEVELIE